MSNIFKCLTNFGPCWEEKIKPLFNRFSKLFNEEAKFRLLTTLKISIIPIASIVVMGLLLRFLLRINLVFFEANGLTGADTLREAFYDYILQSLDDFWPFISGLYVFLVFAGFYVSHLFLRPFRLIGDYCEKFVKGENVIYNPGFITDLRLLSSFGEYFFNYMENALDTGHLAPAKIMRKFTGIHHPVFEKVFFAQFFSLLIISSIAGGSIIFKFISDLNSHLIELSIKTLKPEPTITYFLNRQGPIFESMIVLVLIFHVVAYVLLAFHLYDRISRPAFGIFSTLRSFLKGDYNARVHLLGLNFLRPQCRKINTYLDYLQEEFGKRSQLKPPGNQE